ncbi:unnamed protein product [Parajaminaea phylloscopi]
MSTNQKEASPALWYGSGAIDNPLPLLQEDPPKRRSRRKRPTLQKREDEERVGFALGIESPPGLRFNLAQVQSFAGPSAKGGVRLLLWVHEPIQTVRVATAAGERPPGREVPTPMMKEGREGPPPGAARL